MAKKKSRFACIAVPYAHRMFRSELSRKGKAVNDRFDTQSSTERLDPLEATQVTGIRVSAYRGAHRVYKSMARLPCHFKSKARLACTLRFTHDSTTRI